jgi:hypothetical protein
MPRGPKGERRPADVIGAAVMVRRIVRGLRPHQRRFERASATSAVHSAPDILLHRNRRRAMSSSGPDWDVPSGGASLLAASPARAHAR